jgi:uncharacterized low-complexity protein
MKNNFVKSPCSIALIGSALASSFAVNAAENPFAMKELASGYMQVAEASKATEGRCGEGKCGAAMMKQPEMKCGAGMAGMSGMSPAPEQKAAEGKCAAKMGSEPSAPAATPESK